MTAISPDIQKLMLIFVRTLSMMWLIPLFSSRMVSGIFKAGLSVLIAFLLFDSVKTGSLSGNDPVSSLLLVMKEVFTGVTIGFFVRILFLAVNVAGEIISLQSGFSFARFMDPFSMVQMSIMEQVTNLMAMMIFFAVDAHHMLIKGLAVSLKELPIGAAALDPPLLQYLINTTGKIFATGLRIGAPVIIALFLVDLSLGILSRMIPQVNVFVEGVSMKILITVIIFSFSLAVIVPGIVSLFKGLDTEFLKIIRIMA
jgi:flagellar biosynthetic protein FliR